jgi:hypothetical protein
VRLRASSSVNPSTEEMKATKTSLSGALQENTLPSAGNTCVTSANVDCASPASALLSAPSAASNPNQAPSRQVSALPNAMLNGIPAYDAAR